jgi:hypothetical protein
VTNFGRSCDDADDRIGRDRWARRRSALPRLLASVAGHADQIGVLDTTPECEVDATLLLWGTRLGTFDWDADVAEEGSPDGSLHARPSATLRRRRRGASSSPSAIRDDPQRSAMSRS